jgi:hypothetical protein
LGVRLPDGAAGDLEELIPSGCSELLRNIVRVVLVVLVGSVAVRSAHAADPVDLLHAVQTELTVSSAHRDQPVSALVDGKLGTAWNSASGGLVGAWVEVRLPTKAQVAAVVLTSGFTKRGRRVDLFTGNHRVAKVRVLHQGKTVGTYPLDTNTRRLQTLPVKGGGGVYRIEVVAVLPGSRPRWREVCISESGDGSTILHILGTVLRFPFIQRFLGGIRPP